MLRSIASALFIGTVTAVLTLALAMALSILLGAENRQNAINQRCLSSESRQLLVEIATELGVDVSSHPPVNIQGLNCSHLYAPIDEEGI